MVKFPSTETVGLPTRLGTETSLWSHMSCLSLVEARGQPGATRPFLASVPLCGTQGCLCFPLGVGGRRQLSVQDPVLAVVWQLCHGGREFLVLGAVQAEAGVCVLAGVGCPEGMVGPPASPGSDHFTQPPCTLGSPAWTSCGAFPHWQKPLLACLFPSVSVTLMTLTARVRGQAGRAWKEPFSSSTGLLVLSWIQRKRINGAGSLQGKEDCWCCRRRVSRSWALTD